MIAPIVLSLWSLAFAVDVTKDKPTPKPISTEDRLALSQAMSEYLMAVATAYETEFKTLPELRKSAGDAAGRFNKLKADIEAKAGPGCEIDADMAGHKGTWTCKDLQKK